MIEHVDPDLPVPYHAGGGCLAKDFPRRDWRDSQTRIFEVLPGGFPREIETVFETAYGAFLFQGIKRRRPTRQGLAEDRYAPIELFESIFPAGISEHRCL
jgi:hypothetical protein